MDEKQKIDWPELFRKIRASGRLLLKVCGIGTVVGLIIALSIPKEYTASTLVAHEGTRSRSFSDIRELANITPGMSASIATSSVPPPFCSNSPMLRYADRRTVPQCLLPDI